MHDPPVVGDALGEILVGGADQYPLNPGILGGPYGRSGQGVIGLELHHGEDGEAGGLEDGLHQRELGEQFWWDALAGLVTGEQVVPERFHDPVGGHTDVSGPVLDHP